MSDELEDLDPELSRLFAAEARHPEAAHSARERVWTQVEAALAFPVPPELSGELTSALPSAAASAVHTVSLTKLLAASVASLVVGGATGAYVTHAVLDARRPIAIVPAPSPPDAPVQPALPNPDAGVEEAPAQPVPAAPALDKPRLRARKDVDSPTNQSELAGERAIIDVVRAAIARGHADSALAGVARHEREYPEGRLREEREGLRVLALVRAGRLGEAEERALGFKQRYPKSLLWPAIDAALRGAR